ncbi:MAG: transglycosylase SLT domain-containing protein [Halothiobacillaceae bacterium]
MRRIVMTILGALLLGTQAVAAQSERELFREALDALSAGNPDQALARLQSLDDYPLRPYLEYRLLRERLDELPVEQVLAFEADWPHFYLAGNLRASLLHRLADQERWPEFLGVHRPEVDDEVTLGCHRLHAEYRLDQPSGQWLSLAREKWLSGTSRPEACDPVFDVLYTRQWVDEDLRRTRIRLAMEQNNPGLARYLARDQSESLRDYLGELERARSEPLAYLSAQLEAGRPSALAGNEIRVAAFRWAARDRLDPVMALAERLPDDWGLTAGERAQIRREIGLRAAWRHRSDALAWLVRVPDEYSDESVRAWRVRAALRALDWAAVLAAFERLEPAEQAEAQWRYWQARALAETGADDRAEAIWRDLAAVPDYYGMLSADRLGQRYALDHPGARFSSAQRAALAGRPGIRMAREFLALGMLRQARLQWNHCLGRLSAEELELAAELADDWAWHDRAAVAVGRFKRVGGHERLDLRYPLPWRDRVELLADRENVSATWIYAVMRRESLFMHDVGSSAGAQGLMQLMPATAEWLGQRRRSPVALGDLTDIDTNLSLGAYYLGYLSDLFGDHQVLATAAYNAGQGRVRQWLPARALPADIWIETVPFTETRRYLRAVLSAMPIFAWRLDEPVEPLARVMSSVEPRER